MGRKRKRKSRSKFEYDIIKYNDKTYMAFNKVKYTQEEALEIAKKEFGTDKLTELHDMYVRYGFGRGYENYYTNKYYLETEKTLKSTPVWVFGGRRVIR